MKFISYDDSQIDGSILLMALRAAEESGLLNTHLIHEIHTLAARYCLERKYEEAEKLYRRALKLREKILGVNHPDIVDSLEKLAVVLQETRGKAEAMAVAFRAQTLALSLQSQKVGA